MFESDANPNTCRRALSGVIVIRTKLQSHIKEIARAENPLIESASQSAQQFNRKMKRSFFRSKKRVVRYGLLSVNIALLFGVAIFIISTRSSEPTKAAPTLSLTTEKELSDPLDALSGADIAVNVAQLVRMDQATAVRNNADSVNTQLDIVPSDSQVVAKPQIVVTELKSIQDLDTYITVEGDTIDSIADGYGISADSIRWSNDLTGSAITAGATIKVPPVSGVIYTVKAGETAKSIADRYSSDEAKIIAFNDAEITGLTVGQEIVIPEGSVPAPVRRSSPATVSGFRFGSSAVYGYNGYDFGYCTWHASNRRAAVGKPIPANLGNASTWKSRAQFAGLATGSTPQQYAVLWHPPFDYYGHVAFVEEMYPDGSILVSDMNYGGWNRITTRTLTPAQAAAYQYIY
jgi:surface antigen